MSAVISTCYIYRIIKFILSLLFCFAFDCNYSIYALLSLLYNEVIDHKEWFYLLIPAILYTLQNSLQYYSMSCLSAPVFQGLLHIYI